MVGVILKLRWVMVVIALFSALHAIAFTAIGIVRGIMGYSLIVQGPPWDGDRAPGIQLARSVDAFLLAMVFFVFSIGVLALFLSQKGGSDLESVPEWMRVRSLSELKFIIWEAILVALVVASVESFVAAGDELIWSALILPTGTLILALAFFLARRA